MADFQNRTLGPKSVNTTTGPVILQPGETRDLAVSDEEAAAMKRLGFLDPSTAENAPSTVDPDQDRLNAEVEALKEANTRDKLLEIAEAEGVAIETDDNKDQLATKIAVARQNA